MKKQTSARSPLIRLYEDEAIINGFAGGGGASTGIEMALGRSPDVAINHDPIALAMHKANHPYYEINHVTVQDTATKLSKKDQTRLVGNSVPPHIAAALVRANLGGGLTLI